MCEKNIILVAGGFTEIHCFEDYIGILRDSGYQVCLLYWAEDLLLELTSHLIRRFTQQPEQIEAVLVFGKLAGTKEPELFRPYSSLTLGWRVIEVARKLGNETPVIFLSAVEPDCRSPHSKKVFSSIAAPNLPFSKILLLPPTVQQVLEAVQQMGRSNR